MGHVFECKVCKVTSGRNFLMRVARLGGLVEHWSMKKNQKNPEENLREIIKALAPDLPEGELEDALRNFTRYIAIAEEVAKESRFNKEEKRSK